MAEPLPKGKHFYIVGRESGLVFEIQDYNLDRGALVVLGEKRDIRHEKVQSLCQMWYSCLVSKTVRSRANNQLVLCLNEDDQLCVDEVIEEEGKYWPTERHSWQFNSKKGYLQTYIDGEPRFLEVADHATDPGSAIICNEETGEDNQRFEAEHLDSPYFMLVSEMGGLCMEVDCGMFGGVKEGAKIVTSKKDGKDQQLWYEDTDGILRTKDQDFAIECHKEPGAAMRTGIHSRPRTTQQWHVMPNDSIINRDKTGYCLDIAQRKNKDGTKVVTWEYNGSESQKWKRDFDLPTKKQKTKKTKKSKKGGDDDSEDEYDPNRRYFLIRSRMNGLVFDIKKSDMSEGARVVMWEENGQDNQLWWEDGHKCIRSKLTGFALQGKTKSNGAPLKCYEFEEDDGDRHWIRGPQGVIINRFHRDKALDIKKGKDEKGTEVVVFDKHGAENQQFAFDYQN